MTKVVNFLHDLSGQYEILKSGTFRNKANDLRLFIGNSTKTNKPNNMLLRLDTDTGKRVFVSGLFRTDAGFCFDTGGKRFVIDVYEDCGLVEIYECEVCAQVIHNWYVQKGKSHR